VSTLEEGAGTPGPQQCHHQGDAARALLAAIAQMGLVLRESQEPVSQLGALFAHLAQMVTDRRAATAAVNGGGAPSAAAMGGLLEQVQSDVFKGIQQLQFYDRLVQHLSHLQDYLIGVANELDSMKTGSQAQEVWDELHAKLRRRLISDEQRGLLDLFLLPDRATRVSAQAARPDYLPPGSFDIF
jgi:Cdc6-like AAA superfamily ATPase